MKVFNTTAMCIPEEHYMVDITERVKEIKKLIDAKKYFTINRARQYGKTTTLTALDKFLSGNYDVVSLDFQDLTDGSYIDESSFVKGLAQVLCDTRDSIEIPLADEFYDSFQTLASEDKSLVMNDIFRIFDRWCKQNAKPIVLIIDEVDTATNNQVFLDFLGKLRSNYLKRAKNPGYKTFHSVILAGVTDVKHLKGIIRPDEDHKLNSPWNIAADFDIDMSLSEPGIKGMLEEYDADHNTGMDTAGVAKEITAYTNGYPFFVSRICQIIDTKLVPQYFDSLAEAWTKAGVDEAVRMILSEDNSLFDSVMGKLEQYPDLKLQLRNILFRGDTVAHLPDDEAQKQLRMYGFIYNKHNVVAITNRIFEMRLCTYFIGESKKNEDLKRMASVNKTIFVEVDGSLNIPLIMEHFIKEHNRIHGNDTEEFLEAEGRERFLTYLAPIINGTGTYSIEEQTSNQRRMDVVVHYLGRRYVIELKIWHGERYNEKGEKQICDYLDYFDLTVGYLLSFNFNKKKEQGVKKIQIGDKTLYEATL